MKQRHIYILLATLCSAFSCIELNESDLINGVEETDKVQMTFSATIEKDVDTKTTLEGSLSDASMRTVWTPSDNIGVVGIRSAMSANEPVIEFVTDITENSEAADFSGTITMAQEYIACYPYKASLKDSLEVFVFDLPGNQTYAEGSFDAKAAPMVAKAKYGEAFDFQNLCGLLAVKIKGTEKVKGVTFIGKDETGKVMPVSGTYEVDMSKYGEEGFPEIKVKYPGYSVSLSCDTAVQLGDEAVPFYFVLPPATYSSIMLLIYTEDGKVLVREGKNPLTVNRSHLKPTADLNFVEATVSFDLSEVGTANCYVVSEGRGVYSFDATIIGNGEYGLVEHGDFHTENPEISPAYMEVLWTDRDDLIYGLSLINDQANFYATGNEGNALVAAKDKSGNILWSWHLWITDSPAEQVYAQKSASYVMLDRNIGATKAYPEGGDDWKETIGTFYQWGRKDPFIVGKYNVRYSKFSSVAESISRPTYFTNDHYTWIDELSNKSWKYDQKTIYDPCPVGYRIPVSNVFSDLFSWNFHDFGIYYMYNGDAEAWYPYSSHIDYYSNYQEGQKTGFIWTVNNDFGIVNLKYETETEDPWIEGNERGHAFQIRCMKDDGHVDISYPRVDVVGFENITEESAVVYANVRDEGISSVTERGLVWGVDSNLDVASENKIVLGEGGGEYTYTLTGLSHSTRYYVRAYAINERGISYSEVASFATPYMGSSMDLSSGGTSNCYQIPPVFNTYSFDAGVKGNSTESIGVGASVEVLWETDKTGYKTTAGSIINNVRYVSGRVYFETVGEDVEGNALIAVKDADGTILWSWHIWVTDVPANHIYKNKYGTFTVQDRNVGATRADRGVGEEWWESTGFEYFWGRKDPFATGAVNTIDTRYTVEEAIKNPTTRTYLEDMNRQWSGEEKTKYDPCPLGYRLPPYNVWNFFQFSRVEGDTYDNGWYILYNTTTYAWYPRALNAESYRSCHDVHVLSGEYGKSLFMHDSNLWQSQDSRGSVRCIQEDGYQDFSFPKSEITAISDLTSHSVTLEVNVTDPGVYAITERGIIIGDHADLTIDEAIKIPDISTGGGEFSITINDLDHSTRYYVRAYAIDVHGAWYSSEVAFYTPYEGGVEDLSRNGTANCYIVRPAYAPYSFDATVKGNSTESIGSPVEAVVLWESSLGTIRSFERGDLIESVSYENGRVTFMLPFDVRPGNALIAVKDASGKILWSWHIWVVDFDPLVSANMYLSGNMMMDRNLGALSATSSYMGAETTGYAEYGLHYQWGRKDPIDEWRTAVPSDAITFYGYDSSKNSLEYSIEHPTEVIDDIDWNNDTKYWGSTKTIYDPCPDGWRVPDVDVWEGWPHASDIPSSSSQYRLIPEPYSTPQAIYPMSGYGDYTYSSQNFNHCGYWWTSVPGTIMQIYWVDDLYTNYWNVSYRLSVRCMKDEDFKVKTSSYAKVTATSATVVGDIEIFDDSIIEEKGFVCSEGMDSPTILRNTFRLVADQTQSDGDFTRMFTGLKSVTSYQVRAYAKTKYSVRYGDVISFTTGSSGGGEGFDNGGDYEWE